MNIQAPFVQICKMKDTEMNNEGSFVQILLMIGAVRERYRSILRLRGRDHVIDMDENGFYVHGRDSETSFD